MNKNIENFQTEPKQLKIAKIKDNNAITILVIGLLSLSMIVMSVLSAATTFPVMDGLESESKYLSTVSNATSSFLIPKGGRGTESEPPEEKVTVEITLAPETTTELG